MAGIILANSDLERLQRTALNPRSGRSSTPSRDSSLRGVSERRVSNWKNTLQAEAENRSRKRVEEQAAAEAAQLRLDAESAASRLENRNRIIEKANSQIFLDSDRMKSFQSAMMLSDVLSEREQQLKVKEQLRILEELRNRKYSELVKHNNRSMVERERQEESDRLKKRIETRRIQLQQLEGIKSKRRAELMEKKLEAQAIAEYNQRSTEEAIKFEQARKLQAIEAHKEYQMAHQYMQERRDGERRRDSLDEASILEFAQRKERMFDQLNERRKEISSNKLRMRQSMIEKEYGGLIACKDIEDARVAAQVIAVGRVQDEKAAQDADNKKRWNADIAECHRAQIAAKQEAKHLESSESKQVATIGKMISHQLQLEEMRQAEIRNKALKDLKHDLTAQMRENQARKADSSIRGRAARNLAEKVVKCDDDAFWRHAESVIREYAEEGNNVVPLVNSLKHSMGHQN